MENTLAEEAMLAFGAAVRLHRTAKGWSQAELAEHMTELGASSMQTTVAKIERGSRPTPISEAAVIAAALGVPVTALLPVDEASTSLSQLVGLLAEITTLTRAYNETHEALGRLRHEIMDALDRWDAATASLSDDGRKLARDARISIESLRGRIGSLIGEDWGEERLRMLQDAEERSGK